MLIIDGNAMMIRGITADIKMEMSEAICRHLVLNSLGYLLRKFKKEYGEVVIAFDSKNSWRKDFFPNYKASRKKYREDSRMDWNKIFEYMDIIKSELREFFPYKIVEVDRCEGDDIIAVLTRYAQKTRTINSGLYDEPEPVMILSSDEDFVQLQSDSVKQVSLQTKKPVTTDMSLEFFLHDHIIRGDKGDGVPNVLSDDDVFVEGRRQNTIYAGKVDEWFSKLPDDEAFKKNYARNKLMIDLSCIPEEYQQRIINTYNDCKPKGRMRLMNYFITKKLGNLMENIQDY